MFKTGGKIDHVLLSYKEVSVIWKMVFRWVDLMLSSVDTLQDLFAWLEVVFLSSNRRVVLELFV